MTKMSFTRTALAAALLSLAVTGASAQTATQKSGGADTSKGATSGATGTGSTGAGAAGASGGTTGTAGAMDKGAGSNTARAAQTGKGASDAKLSSGDRKFVEKAAQGGIAEVELGKLAATKAQSDQVKQFAQRMVDDHSKANDQLKQIASSKGVTVPTDTDAKHKREMDRLSKLSGAQFDREYMKHMVSDHKEDVSDFRKQAKSAKDADVKSFASSTLPTLEQHLQLAQQTESATRSASRSSEKSGTASSRGSDMRSAGTSGTAGGATSGTTSGTGAAGTSGTSGAGGTSGGASKSGATKSGS